jgi:hypothetical protein
LGQWELELLSDGSDNGIPQHIGAGSDNYNSDQSLRLF